MCLRPKLNMSKVYDGVEWGYLENIIEKMGFANTWIQWLVKCVRLVSYAIIINGHAIDVFYPSRGLRQGDPLSPYLILICVEGLSRMLESAKRQKVIRGVVAARNGPRVSHLLFADDSMFFCEVITSFTREI